MNNIIRHRGIVIYMIYDWFLEMYPLLEFYFHILSYFYDEAL